MHLSTGQLLVTLFVGILICACFRRWGALRQLGRRPPLITYGDRAGDRVPALMWFDSGPSFGRLLAVGLWFSLIFGGYNGSMVVF
jgi:MHS family citrate/tricarballylate:H+ symporter-like MFS transporter